MAFIDDVKKVLRVSNSEMNDEIQGLIDSCKKDLELKGLHSTKIVETDPSIANVIKLYCKAFFGYNNPDANRFEDAYNSQAKRLAICGYYLIGTTDVVE